MKERRHGDSHRPLTQPVGSQEPGKDGHREDAERNPDTLREYERGVIFRLGKLYPRPKGANVERL